MNETRGKGASSQSSIPAELEKEQVVSDNSHWVKALNLTDIARNDVKRWDYSSRSFAIFRTADDRCYATDDICTHEYARISDGFVMNHTIECPRHASSFDFTTGEALNPPACINLKTYATKIEDGVIYIDVR